MRLILCQLKIKAIENCSNILNISENNIQNYNNLTGAYTILTISGKFLIGYNKWRKQWEFPAERIKKRENARQAAVRELFEGTHQIK